MNVLVGGALAPVHTIPPLQTQRKPGPGLRLPSFDILGIASPHPDRFTQLTLDGTWDGAVAEPLSESMAGSSKASCGASNLSQACSASLFVPDQRLEPLDLLCGDARGRAVSSPVPNYVATLTPPAEKSDLLFPSVAAVSHAPLESDATVPDAGESSTATTPTAASGVGMPPIVVDQAALNANQTWIAETIEVLGTYGRFIRDSDLY